MIVATVSLTPQDYAMVARELIDRVAYLELIETHNNMAARIRLGYAAMPTTYELRRAIQRVTGQRMDYLPLPDGDDAALAMWYFHREVRACLVEESGIDAEDVDGDLLLVTSDVTRGEELDR